MASFCADTMIPIGPYFYRRVILACVQIWLNSAEACGVLLEFDLLGCKLTTRSLASSSRLCTPRDPASSLQDCRPNKGDRNSKGESNLDCSKTERGGVTFPRSNIDSTHRPYWTVKVRNTSSCITVIQNQGALTEL